MAKIRLSVAERDWLRHAIEKGYEKGFFCKPFASLVRLERMGFLERNPSSKGAETHWRVTDAGISRWPRLSPI